MHHAAVRPFLPSVSPFAAGVLACLFATVALTGCNSPEVDAVREYKAFLDKAKSPLAAMNKAREELYQLGDVQQMLPLFQDKLLPQVRTLSDLARTQPKPATRLGDIHDTLRETLQRYADATDRLTTKLKSKKEDDRESAIVAWGEDDKRFGDEMNALANDLAKYLDEVKK